jgi:hypothetical protein
LLTLILGRVAFALGYRRFERLYAFLLILYIHGILDVDDDLFLRLVHGVVYVGEGLRDEGRTHF